MSGAAALIALYSLPDLLGVPAPSAHRLASLAGELGTQILHVSPAALGVGLFTIAAALLLKRYAPRSPFMLLALLGASALAFVLDRMPLVGAAAGDR